jgi:ABC-type Fe3+ transport system substrate-binding protein
LPLWPEEQGEPQRVDTPSRVGKPFVNRRRFLTVLGASLGGAAAASLAAACGQAAPSAQSAIPPPPTTAPKPPDVPRAAPAGATLSPSPAAQPAAPAAEDEQALVAAATREGKLSILHGMPQETLEALGAAFRKKHPFLSLEIERQRGLASFEKFSGETRAGRHLRDVVHVADIPAYRKLVADKMILQYRVPTDARFPAAFKIGDGYAYIPYKTEVVIPVNDQLVSKADGDLLKTWEGILDPRWKGRIGLSDTSGGAAYATVMMLLHPPVAGRFGPDFLKRLAAQDPQIFNNSTTAIQRLLAGEIHVLFTHWESDAITQYQKGAPIRWYAPPPVPSYGNSPYGISANAPHPNAAKLWQNWFTGTEGATALNTIYNSKSTMTGHSNSVDLPKADWYMPIVEAWVPDPDEWESNQKSDIDLFQQIFNYRPGG